ncbi:MAG: DUF4397 domain-containing protein [Terriglobales bacterium]|jgi:hypothetical protein
MKLRTRVTLQLAALCLVLAATGFAADDNAYLYIVHGIPGRNIADNANPGFPIDVLVNGKTCLVRNLTFDNTSGPFTFAAGTYSIAISESNTLAPCTNAPIISSSVTLLPDTNTSAVATVSGGEPALLTFADDLFSVLPGNARFVFTQVADAPALEATLTQLDVKAPKTFTVSAAPGTEQWIGVPYGAYLVKVTAEGSTTVLASETITFPDQSVTLTYAVGESANNSVGLVNRTVRDVF